MWTSLHRLGFEHLRPTEVGGEVQSDGIVVTGLDGHWHRFRYLIRLDRDWNVRTLELLDLDAPHVGLDLYADANGNLRTTGRRTTPSPPAADVDLAFTPFTNTLPIRRYRLDVGESKTLDMLYLAAPDRGPVTVRQRYTRLPDQTAFARYRFESLDSDFQAELTVDGSGLVVDYPGLFQKVAEADMRSPTARGGAQGETGSCA